MEKDLPWKMKESRVLEILQAVRLSFTGKYTTAILSINRPLFFFFFFLTHLITLKYITGVREQIDSNTDGLVDFTEFVAATLHVDQLEEHSSEKWENRSQAAFEKFDVDKDGYITPDELKMVS